MSLTISITEDDVYTALRSFLLLVAPQGTEVIKAQDNRVGEPRALDFITMTPMSKQRLSTNVTSYDSEVDKVAKVEQATQFGFQLDIHGPVSANCAQIVSTLFRDTFAVDKFNEFGFGVAPLFASDPRQIPFINGEQQFEERWVVQVELQANPVVAVAQEFFDKIAIELIEVDAEYPPTD